jgi:hypothetical protein
MKKLKQVKVAISINSDQNELALLIDMLSLILFPKPSSEYLRS